ncbi:MAG: hypothetical protein AAB391_00340 [Patescibacteria group bacterium]
MRIKAFLKVVVVPDALRNAPGVQQNASEPVTVSYTLDTQGKLIATPILPSTTADWKTYRNEKYGFELKIPSFFGEFADRTAQGALYSARVSGVMLPEESGHALSVTIGVYNLDKYSFASGDKKVYAYDISSNKCVTYTKGTEANLVNKDSIKINGTEWCYVENKTYPDVGSYGYFFVNETADLVIEVLYTYEMNPVSDPRPAKPKVDLKDIVSTFKLSHPSTKTTTEMSVNIMVPRDMDAYEKAMNEYIFDGKPNPSGSWPFVKKQVTVTVPKDTDIMKASVQAVAEVIDTQGGFQGSRVVYFKLVNGTAYILLGMDLDGWAGVSVSLAKIKPLVEKTLLQFPGITSVTFSPAPGDTMDSISHSLLD